MHRAFDEVVRAMDLAYANRPRLSAPAPAEPQANEGRCAVATGSLPVLDAEGLAKLWVDEAAAIRINAYRNIHSQPGRDRARTQARQLEKCAKELRLLMAYLKSRQPEENYLR